MNYSIFVVGPGRLGGYVAFRALQLGLGKCLYIAGRTKEKTFGIARDLQEAFPNSEIVPIDNYELSCKVDFTFFTFSTLKWKPNIGVNDRWIEAQSNFSIVEEIASSINPSNLGDVFILSNPVDIVTNFVAHKFRGSRIFGLGISLDERRIARILNTHYGKKIKRVPCVGEHGHNIVPLLSHILPDSIINLELYKRIKEDAFKFTEPIIRCTSIPFYGPLSEIDRLLTMMCKKSTGTFSASVPLNGYPFGISDISLGVPVHMKDGKLTDIEPLKLNNFESELFSQAAIQCKENYRKLTQSLIRYFLAKKTKK
ncbi:MAG: malate dehydrogenase [Candidatus Scalindua rubra]|uniref:Malate dehydrogenase n=1 Tax=Candidatus Scalindua rubra TaxID=1872076 RepID=A0A1E3X2B2_9BACT|nr:MAG: malate dehydrogenase [Candidatus Scalindua rubra]